MPEPFRVLSVDGGGVRGFYSAVLLHGLAQRLARMRGSADTYLDVGSRFNLVVGTSTGAIIAAGLAAGISLEQVIDLYHEHSAQIFKDPVPAKRVPLLRWVFRNRKKAANSPEPLRQALESVLGCLTLGEVFAKRRIALCIPAVDMRTLQSWVFKTPHDPVGNRLQRDNLYRLVDVVLASTAAPLVLPIASLRDPNASILIPQWFADGGLWANNPVLCALVEALAIAPAGAPIQIVSVSTCPPFKGRSLDAASANRGILDWQGGIKALEAALDSQSYAYDYITRAVIAHICDRPVDYVRLRDPNISSDDAHELRLDNPGCLDLLAQLASQAVDLNVSDATAGVEPRSAMLVDVFRDIAPIKPQ